jgi:uncharacterized protein YwqG
VRQHLSRESNATWIDAVRSRKRPARRLVLTEGDAGAERVTKIGGAPWWPRGEPRPQCDRGHDLAFYMQILLSDVPGWEADDGLLSFHYCDECMHDGNAAIGWSPPETEGMEDVAHPEASDLRFFPADARSNDGMGVVTAAEIKAYGVALEDIEEIPGPGDLPESIDLPDDFFGGTDLDPERPEGFAFVARCKIGGWPAWDQDAQWPTCEHHGQMEFVAQIDHEVGADTYWGGGGHAFLFACPPGCIGRRAELVIQNT